VRGRLARWLDKRWYGSARPPVYLRPAAGLFGAVSGLRRKLYRWDWLASIAIPARVVVVGNLTVGGNGKTPLVAWLACQLTAAGVRVGIVTRGYGGRQHYPLTVTPTTPVAHAGDEALLLARLTGVPVVACRDRVAAARSLCETCHPDLILADDGLQHYRLARDMEIVAIDTIRGFGNGALLPAGPLRELPARLAQADAVVFKGAGEAPTEADGTPNFVMNYALEQAVPLAGGPARTLEWFRGRPLRALAAIAEPEGFFRALRLHGLEIEAHALPDHAPIADFIRRLPSDRPLLITEKDAVKLPLERLEHVWRVPLRVIFSESDAANLLALVRGAT